MRIAPSYLVVAALGLVTGGAIGVFATRTLYGESSAALSVARPPAPLCPPCNEIASRVVRETEAFEPTLSAAVDEQVPFDPRLRVADMTSGAPRPGLPVEAVERALLAMNIETATCSEPDRAADLEDHELVLLLTVTATGGSGFIGDLVVRARHGIEPASRVESCVIAAARRTRFSWSGPDGEQKAVHVARVAREIQRPGSGMQTP